MTRKTLRNLIALWSLLVSAAMMVNAQTPGSPGTLDLSFGGGDGKVVTSLGNNLSGGATDVAIDAAGRIVVVGNGDVVATGQPQGIIVRYTPTGELDSSFGGGDGIATVFINLPLQLKAVKIDSQNRIIAAGWLANSETERDFFAIRLTQAGAFDPSFAINGVFLFDTFNGNDLEEATDVALDSAGRIVISGFDNPLFGERASDSVVVRVTPNGFPDDTFDGDGIFKFNAAGLPTQSDLALSVEIDAMGRYVVGGVRLASGRNNFYVARVLPSGALDTTFGGGGGFVATQVPAGVNGDSAATGVAVANDGKIVLGGQTRVMSNDAIGLTRYNASGSLDGSFGNGGIVHQSQPPTPKFPGQIKLDSANNILMPVQGLGPPPGDFDDFHLLRYAPAGVLDTRFSGDGIATVNVAGTNGSGVPGGDTAKALTIDAAGKIIVVGGSGILENNQFTRFGFAVIRLHGNPRSHQFDFDGDGKDDVSVVRDNFPLGYDWYVLGSQNGLISTPWGLGSDKLAPADYDGDGKTDYAVMRDFPNNPNFSYYYIIESANSTMREVQFGSEGDRPLSGDFDGDGKADLAVCRTVSASEPSIFIFRPSGTPGADFRTIPWGSSDTLAVVGDYDGDGKADAAVVRVVNSSLVWLVLQSSNNQFLPFQFGEALDRPVPGDYDGDGKTDFAVFRNRDETWYIQQSRDGFRTVRFGLASDKVVPADYDGDNRTDIAVFRNGNWFIRQSRDGFRSVRWGLSGDIPIPGAFEPFF